MQTPQGAKDGKIPPVGAQCALQFVIQRHFRISKTEVLKFNLFLWAKPELITDLVSLFLKIVNEINTKCDLNMVTNSKILTSIEVWQVCVI